MKKILLVLAALPLGCSITALRPAQEKKSLYKAYAHLFPVGAAINPDVDFSTEERKTFITAHYNSLTAENQMKPKQIHPQEDKWNWEPADKIVAFAREHHMKVRGHTLVWQQNVPSWMIRNGRQLASKQTVYEKMQQHINAVVGRYRKDVYCWDVVNEAISDKPDEMFRTSDSLYMICGAEYVAKAFAFARKADPHAKLYYNDYRFSNPIKRKKIYDLVKSLVDQHVPIDGVGLQSHYVPGEITAAYLQETIDMFSRLGLKVQITELDVSVYNYRDKNHPDSNTDDDVYTAARKKQQEEMYTMLFNLYRKNSSVITGITFWGTSDMRRNYRTVRIGKMDYPFLFDEFMKPKPVFDKVISF